MRSHDSGGLAAIQGSRMQNPALDQMIHSLMWIMLPVVVLAGLANSLPKKRGRRSKRGGTASSRKGGWADDLVLAPWWVSFALAVLSFALLPRLIPAAALLASILGLFFLFLSAMSGFRKWRTSHSLDSQTSLESIAALPWKRFEDLLGEAYRRQGYKVTETLGGGADRGVDLVLSRDGQTTLVQCKRWLNRPVPVQTARELYGVMHDRAASAAKLVTTSSFTSETVAFAQGKPIQLVGSQELLRLIRSVQTSARIAAVPPPLPTLHLTPDCPKCGSSMVMKTAKRGPNAGSQFWGCPNYPKCKGTREIV